MSSAFLVASDAGSVGLYNTADSKVGTAVFVCVFTSCVYLLCV